MNSLGVRFMGFESNGSPRMVPRLWWEFESMNSLGLVAPEPNPFVFTGKPKVGQVWQNKAMPDAFVLVKAYTSFGRGEVQYVHFNVNHDIDGQLSLDKFLKYYRFSH